MLLLLQSQPLLMLFGPLKSQRAWYRIPSNFGYTLTYTSTWCISGDDVIMESPFSRGQIWITVLLIFWHLTILDSIQNYADIDNNKCHVNNKRPLTGDDIWLEVQHSVPTVYFFKHSKILIVFVQICWCMVAFQLLFDHNHVDFSAWWVCFLWSPHFPCKVQSIRTASKSLGVWVVPRGKPGVKWWLQPFLLAIPSCKLCSTYTVIYIVEWDLICLWNPYLAFTQNLWTKCELHRFSRKLKVSVKTFPNLMNNSRFFKRADFFQCRTRMWTQTLIIIICLSFWFPSDIKFFRKWFHRFDERRDLMQGV